MEDSTHFSLDLDPSDAGEEEVLLATWRDLTEKKLNWGSYPTWTNKNYVLLSVQISELAKIAISADTLKRIFGKIKTDVSYSPQFHTKNALAKFHGFHNWEEFRNAVLPQLLKGEVPKITHVEEFKQESKPPLNRTVNNKAFFFLFAVATLIALFFLITKYYLKDTMVKVEFRGLHLEGQHPLTSVLYYKVSGVADTALYIEGVSDLASLSTIRRDLDPNRNSITYPFVDPGYYTLNLRSKSKIYGSLNVNVYTKGWEAFVEMGQHHEYFDKFIKDSALWIPREKINPVTTEPYRCSFANIKDFGVSIDSLTVETAIKNSAATQGIPGYDVTLNLQGEKGSILLSFSRPGDWYWFTQKFSEIELNGQLDTIPQFGQDLSTWRKVKIECKNRTINVLFEGRSIYKTAYKQTMGKLRGIVFVTKGSGAIDFVKMTDANNKTLFEDNFDH